MAKAVFPTPDGPYSSVTCPLEIPREIGAAAEFGKALSSFGKLDGIPLLRVFAFCNACEAEMVGSRSTKT